MKTISRIIIVFICAALLYSTATWGYVFMQMRPVTPISPVSAAASPASRPQVHMLHQVNTAQRAKAKDTSFAGFELDLNRVNGRLAAAHDESGFAQAATLSDIFSAVQTPGAKTWWIDVKTALTQEDINEILALAKQYNIHPRQLLFETDPGPTAALLTKNGLPVLLGVPEGFDNDRGSPERRAELNTKLKNDIDQYQPLAIAASMGKYPYLKAYFPHYNKAIYNNNTVRPSLKKQLYARAMAKDPSVLAFMQDEYTGLPF